MGMSTRAVVCKLKVHFCTISHLKKMFQTIQYVHHIFTTAGPQASSPPRSFETTWTAAAVIIWQNPNTCTQTGMRMCTLIVLIRISTWLLFVAVTDLSGQMLTFDACTLERCFLHGWTLDFTTQGRWQTALADRAEGILHRHFEILCPILLTFICNHHLMLQHDNVQSHVAKDLDTIPGSRNHPSSCMAGNYTHWACLGSSGSAVCSSSCQYPATLHRH